MKRVGTLLVVVLLAWGALAPFAQAAPRSPFTGSWIGADPAPPVGDGSTLHLSISGGEHPRITFVDLRGNICVRNDAPTDTFASRLAGHAHGNELSAMYVEAHCGSTSFEFLRGWETTFWYDPATDTLTDGYSTFWRR
ncbi:MAG TPA: hypothetical protein VLA23_04005 [Candidatus Limnocylindrales bacterium]|nr:hypothetical protein [Candidatus Limnocylindrales bacterium]